MKLLRELPAGFSDDEPRLVLDTDKLARDLESLRAELVAALGDKFGTLVMQPRFLVNQGRLSALLTIKFAGLGKMSAHGFEVAAAKVVTDTIGAKGKVQIERNAVAWSFALEIA